MSDDLSTGYWDGARRGALVLQRCTACGHVRHYPTLLCPVCHSDGVEPLEACGRGTVHSWTVAHHAFDPAFADDLPYTLVTVDVEEGPRVLARLEPDTAGLQIGRPVTIGFAPGAGGVPVPLARPA
ncbi:hypothetical protein EV383_4044 [Pseudonocardia sediminis]|uniref:OB-fold protein n=1 Tax=Pseudonocardia sediminis TaxID=1397368 RepID=A0A4Q7UYW2_PSEST|nr:OB-fold domain-containing protein [Pseudonocardia sediminis]RZT87136.1 hypothetical protein EV383_4044 [Pseudonocardia sediminis]